MLIWSRTQISGTCYLRDERNDEPLEEELPEFESRLAEALREAIEEKDTKACDVSRISWQKIAREVIR